MTIKNIFYILIISIFLNGCISVTKELPAFSTYTIKLDNKKTVSNKQLPYTIEIKEPKSLASTNSKFISYFQDDSRSESYALSRWSDNPTKMIQKAMVNHLSNTNNYQYINSSKVNVLSDYKIISELDNFNQYIKDNSSYVEFNIKVYLKKSNKVYFKNFTYTKACKQNNAKEAVRNLNILTNTFVNDLDKWLLSKLS